MTIAVLTARLIFDRRDLILIVAPLFLLANIAKMKLANFCTYARIMHPRNGVSNRQLSLIHLSEYEI